MVGGNAVACLLAECFNVGECGGVAHDYLVGGSGVAGKFAGVTFHEEAESGFFLDIDGGGNGAFGEAFGHDECVVGVFGVAGAAINGVGEVFSVEPAAVLG